MSKIEVDQVDPQSGTTLTLGTSGDTIVVPSGVTFNSSAATNTLPSSVVTTTGTQTLTNKSIVATQLTGTIATSQIADDAITLEKMAPGTDGNLITYDASGNPAAVATGSAGQVLTSAGAGAPPTFAAASGGVNTPAFEAKAPGDQTYSDATATVIPANSEVFDTDSAYNTSTYRFTPQVAGKYFCYAHAVCGGNNDTLRRALISIKKNSSNDYTEFNTGGLNFAKFGVTHSIVYDLNGSSDYIESTVYIDQASGTPSTDYAKIGAFKLIT